MGRYDGTGLVKRVGEGWWVRRAVGWWWVMGMKRTGGGREGWGGGGGESSLKFWRPLTQMSIVLASTVSFCRLFQFLTFLGRKEAALYWVLDHS